MTRDINILAVGYGRHLFDAENFEHKRMECCTREVGQFHMIVFTRQTDKLHVLHSDNGLVLHPTNSKTRAHMFFDAIGISMSLLKNREGNWVVTAQDPFEAGLVAYIVALIYGVRLNIQEHGDVFSTSAWKRESLGNRFRYFVGRLLLKRADTVRVVSKRTLSTMQNIGIPPEKIICLAVHTDVSVKKLDEPVTNLHKNCPKDTVIILSMARFVPQKNLPLLIRAFAIVHAKVPHTRLVLVGAGPEEKILRELVITHNLTESVVFEPWTGTPAVYMQSADIYALSSNYEGWGRVLIEAMLAGKPVITTDVGCAGEVLINDVHGFVVPTGDMEAFATQLTLLAQEKGLRNSFGVRARKYALLEHTTIEEYAQLWADVFHKTVG